MPSVPPSSKILVTGANGFVALYVVKRLLEGGYVVRAATRSLEKGLALKAKFKGYEDQIELVTVPDITEDGAFDEAVKGVQGIEHMASPVANTADHPDDLIVPAVNGTLGILRSALKNGQDVKRIVITSSFVAAITFTEAVSEKTWNDAAVKEVEEKGADAAQWSLYPASKTLAERAAWKFYEEHKDQVSWDITALNPPLIFGPPLHGANTPEDLTVSMTTWWDAVIDTERATGNPHSASFWVDVRDVAEAHTLALEKDAAGGERIITTPGPFVWQEIVNVANAPGTAKLAKYKPLPEDLALKPVYPLPYDVTKEARIFGIKFKSLEESTKETFQSFAGLGW